MSMHAKNLLLELLAIPSINPAFGGPEKSWLGEGKLTDFLQELVQSRGWRWLRQEVHPGRENLVAWVPGTSADTSPRKITLWEVHQDTVGVEGLKVAPDVGTLREGRIYGRGACDVKGAMAAMFTALVEVTETNQLQRDVLLAFMINEECGFTGAKALSRLWSESSETGDSKIAEQTHGTLGLDELRALRPTRALVAEPTDLSVVAAHKGLVRWRCHTRGRAAHSSQPHLGKNAIYDMQEVIGAIRTFDAEVLAMRGADCMCGRPTISVNAIQGGTGANVVADHVAIDIDFRLMPGGDPLEALQELKGFIAERISSTVVVEHDAPWNQGRGLAAGTNQAWAEKVAGVVRSTGLPGEIMGVPYGTDAWVFAALGIPTVICGPGSIAQAHTEDEWISLAELDRGVEVYRRLAGGMP